MGSLVSRERAMLEVQWKGLFANPNFEALRTNFLGMENIKASFHYNSLMISSYIFLIMYGLFAIETIGFTTIWNSPLINMLAFGIIGAIAITIHGGAFWVRDIKVRAERLVGAIADTISPGLGAEVTPNITKQTFLSSAPTHTRSHVNVHFWLTLIFYVTVEVFLIVWFCRYNHFGHISHISNAYMRIEWTRVQVMSTWYFIIYFFMTIKALDALNSTFTSHVATPATLAVMLTKNA